MYSRLHEGVEKTGKNRTCQMAGAPGEGASERGKQLGFGCGRVDQARRSPSQESLTSPLTADLNPCRHLAVH